jgi:hypothetical protein
MSDDDFNISEEIKIVPLDMEKVKTNIPTFSSVKLCEMIVCHRYFGSYKEISILCMEELARRRIAGDNYNFEDYIEESLKQLPPLSFSTPVLGDVLRSLSIGRKK